LSKSCLDTLTVDPKTLASRSSHVVSDLKLCYLPNPLSAEVKVVKVLLR
jgi:hypothetical protein